MNRPLAIATAILVFSAAGCGSGEHAGGPPAASSIGHFLVYEKLTGEKGLWIANTDGSDPRQLVPDGEAPVISPDGRWVAYGIQCEAFEDTGLNCEDEYVVATEPGAKPRRVAEKIGWTTTWSPDSRTLVTTHPISVGEDRLVSIDVAGGRETTLAKGAFWGWSISPDNKEIVFARASPSADGWMFGGPTDLFVVGLDGGEAKRITDTGDAMEPVWGPKSIAFSKVLACADKPKAPDERCKDYAWALDEIWQIQPDGTGRKPITAPLPDRYVGQGCLGLKPLGWSTHGRALLTASWCEFEDYPVAVDPLTGATRYLGSERPESAVSLSQDGRFVLARADTGPETPPAKNSVLIIPYTGGDPKVVATGATTPSWNR